MKRRAKKTENARSRSDHKNNNNCRSEKVFDPHHSNIVRRHICLFLISLFCDALRFALDEALLQNIRLDTLLLANAIEGLVKPWNALSLPLAVHVHALLQSVEHCLPLGVQLRGAVVVVVDDVWWLLLHGRIRNVLNVVVVAHLLEHVGVSTREVPVHSVHYRPAVIYMLLVDTRDDVHQLDSNLIICRATIKSAIFIVVASYLGINVSLLAPRSEKIMKKPRELAPENGEKTPVTKSRNVTGLRKSRKLSRCLSSGLVAQFV